MKRDTRNYDTMIIGLQEEEEERERERDRLTSCQNGARSKRTTTPFSMSTMMLYRNN